jgi:RimJ/RimL family protein N-acetyltransferase
MSYFPTSKRLNFRVITADDLDFIADMVSDPEVMRFYPRVLDRAGAEEWLGKVLARQQKDGYCLWHVSDRITGEPIGQVGPILQEVDDAEETEIGYMLRRQCWRKGYASEAACAVRD